MIRRLTLALLLVLGVGAPARAQVDEMISVRLDKSGATRTIPFSLAEPRILRMQAYFPPTEVGEVFFQLKDAADKEVAWDGDRTVPAGEYHVVVSARGASPQDFPVKILSDSLPVPDAGRDAKSATRLPLGSRVHTRLRVESEAAWFRIDPAHAGILSVQVRLSSGQGTPMFAIMGPDKKPLYRTGGSKEYLGARYAPVEAGKRYYLKLWADLGGGAIVELETMVFGLRPGKGGGLAAMGVPDGSELMGQLDLVAQATGTRLTKAETPQQLRRELEEAMGVRPPGSGWAVAGWILGLGGIGAAAWFWWRRPRKPFKT
jgi:hypothetical protein